MASACDAEAGGTQATRPGDGLSKTGTLGGGVMGCLRCTLRTHLWWRVKCWVTPVPTCNKLESSDQALLVSSAYLHASTYADHPSRQVSVTAPAHRINLPLLLFALLRGLFAYCHRTKSAALDGRHSPGIGQRDRDTALNETRPFDYLPGQARLGRCSLTQAGEHRHVLGLLAEKPSVFVLLPVTLHPAARPKCARAPQ